ncbi:MAG: chromosome segregation SMC family protein, partial [Armatimonadota bacterium]
MYLKSLELHGFKSFADKTRFEFGEGITAVVGPNGAGKSNIADAVMWVLGEQSMRALRSSSHRDVIFAGSNGRRPLNLAEVSLTLDNSDGQLDIGFSEVTVSRRIYRSGESEYLINKTKCRLRDVHELFLDTGIGKQAYSIVTQGEIDAILSIRSEDRRELLEEVAGIQKYRQRRRETMRKLEATESNITRLADICHELASQRIPLAEQAEKARRYRELTAQLSELELDLLATEYARHRERLGRLIHDEQILQADLGGARAETSKLDNEAERIKRDAEHLQEQIQQLRDDMNRAESLAQQEDSAQALCDERRRSIEVRRQSLKHRLQVSAERLERRTQQLRALQAQREAVEAAAAAAREQVEEAEAASEEIRKRLDAHAAQVDDVRDRRMKRAGEAVAAQSEKESLEAREEEILGRLERIGPALERAQQRKAEVETALREAQARLTDAEAQVAELEALAREDRAAFTEAQKLAAEQDAKRTIMERRASSAESRVRVLEEVVESLVGVESGVQAVCQAAREGRLKGIHGTVGELINVPEKYEPAIETALGQRLHWVVTDSHEDALAARGYLRETNGGRATFLPLGALGSVTIPASATLAGAEDGVIGVADRLVKAHRQYRRLVQFLLGDIIVTADW